MGHFFFTSRVTTQYPTQCVPMNKLIVYCINIKLNLYYTYVSIKTNKKSSSGWGAHEGVSHLTIKTNVSTFCCQGKDISIATTT